MVAPRIREKRDLPPLDITIAQLSGDDAKTGITLAHKKIYKAPITPEQLELDAKELSIFGAWAAGALVAAASIRFFRLGLEIVTIGSEMPGAGSVLLKYVLDKARADGRKICLLFPTASAFPWWMKRGFLIVHGSQEFNRHKSHGCPKTSAFRTAVAEWASSNLPAGEAEEVTEEALDIATASTPAMFRWI